MFDKNQDGYISANEVQVLVLMEKHEQRSNFFQFLRKPIKELIQIS